MAIPHGVEPEGGSRVEGEGDPEVLPLVHVRKLKASAVVYHAGMHVIPVAVWAQAKG